MNVSPTLDPRAFFEAVNEADHDAFMDLGLQMRADPQKVDACRRFTVAVTKPLIGDGSDAPPFEGVAARSVVDVVSMPRAFTERRDLPLATAVLGSPSADPAEFDARREAAEF